MQDNDIPYFDKRSTNSLDTRVAVIETKLDFTVAQNDRIESNLTEIHETIKADLVPLKENYQNMRGGIVILSWIGSIVAVILTIFHAEIFKWFK